jgi:hypothetical protein
MKCYLAILALSLSSVFAVDNSKTAYMDGVLKDVVGAGYSNGHSNIRGDRRLQQVCLPNFEYTTQKGLTISGLVDFVVTLNQALNAEGCPHNFMDELRLVLGGVSVEEVWTYFYVEGLSFWSSQDSKNFADIGDGTDVFIKNFFDGMSLETVVLEGQPLTRSNTCRLFSSLIAGGTYWNEARETTNTNGDVVNVLSVDPGEKIVEIQNTDAVSGLIDLPEQIVNFEECELRAAMCCWVQDRQADNDGNCQTPYDENCVDADPTDNTDICGAVMGRSPQSNRVQNGFSLFPGGSEGATHCHGFAWTENKLYASAIFKGNTLFHVSLFDHLYTRGYVKNVPGAPMCGCVEQMPIVSRADCTQTQLVQATTFAFRGDNTVEVTPSGEWEVQFNSCQGINGINNNLLAHYALLVEQDKATQAELEALAGTVLGPGTNCSNVINNFLDNVPAGR